MTETALAAGIAAFRQGLMRTSNPCDPSSDEWMCWRDGWEQAKAVADHIADGTAERCYGSPPAGSRLTSARTSNDRVGADTVRRTGVMFRGLRDA
jgi:hypothetical protein